jgi:hypothetical protein
MKAIDLFSDWALNDRDLGMEKKSHGIGKKDAFTYFSQTSGNFFFC